MTDLFFLFDTLLTRLERHERSAAKIWALFSIPQQGALADLIAYIASIRKISPHEVATDEEYDTFELMARLLVGLVWSIDAEQFQAIKKLMPASALGTFETIVKLCEEHRRRWN